MGSFTPSGSEPLNLIAGDWVPARSGARMAVVSPRDGQHFAEIADSDAADIDAAVAAARAALETGDWGRLSAAERGRLLMRYAAAILADADALAAIETRDNGKPLAQGDKTPLDGHWPTSAWEPGYIVKDAYPVSLPAALPLSPRTPPWPIPPRAPRAPRPSGRAGSATSGCLAGSRGLPAQLPPSIPAFSPLSAG